MVSSGGMSNSLALNWSEPWRHALGIYDLSALEWKDGDEADAPEYETPAFIQDWYGDG